MGFLNSIYKQLDKYDKRLDNKIANRKEPVNLYKWSIENEIVCSECGKYNNINDNYCSDCGHKLRTITNDKINRKYCPICKEKVSMDMEYCSNYGHEIKVSEKIRRCSVCGEWIDNERYCINCGHDTMKRSRMFLSLDEIVNRKTPKVCENCGEKHPRFYNYCEYCGTKLIRK